MALHTLAGEPANGSRMAAATNDCTHTIAMGSAVLANGASATTCSPNSNAPSSVQASPAPSTSPCRSESNAEPTRASARPRSSRPLGRWRRSSHAQNAASSDPAQVRNAELPALVDSSPRAWK